MTEASTLDNLISLQARLDKVVRATSGLLDERGMASPSKVEAKSELPTSPAAVEKKAVPAPPKKDGKTTIEILARLVGSERFADIAILVANQQKVPAHALLLACKSAVLEQLLFPPNAPKATELHLEQYSTAAVSAMLEEIYCDRPLVTDDTFTQCLELAKRFALPGLQQACLRHLREGTTVDNACARFDQALQLFPDEAKQSVGPEATDEAKAKSEQEAKRAAALAEWRKEMSKPVELAFDPARTETDHMALSNNNRSITLTDRAYSGALTSYRIPVCRRFTFKVRVDACPGPNYTIGVATPDCQTKGGTWRFTAWLVCGHQGGTVWHAGTSRAYGKRPEQGDIITVIVERENKQAEASIRFNIGDQEYPIAYHGLPRALVPCVDLGNEGDSLTLLTGLVEPFEDDGPEGSATSANAEEMEPEGVAGLLAFIEKHAEQVLASEAMVNLSRDALRRIVTSEKLSVEEIDVFRACGRWAMAELKRQQASKSTTADSRADAKAGAMPTPQDLRETLGDLFFDIRFPQISVSDLATVITPSGMLSGEELVELYVANADKSKQIDKWRKGMNPRQGSVIQWVLDPVFRLVSTSSGDGREGANDADGKEGWINGSVPLTKGKHAWRTQVKAFDGDWFCIAIAGQYHIPKAASWTTSTFWGWSNVSFAYRGGKQQRCPTDWQPGHTLDALFDVDKGEFKVFNLNTGREVVLANIPSRPDSTTLPNVLWAPHFNARSRTFRFRVQPIRPDQYGKKP